MKITEMIESLKRELEEHGDVEVTCTHSTLSDGYCFPSCNIPAVFETTAETLIVNENKTFGKHIRICL